MLTRTHPREPRRTNNMSFANLYTVLFGGMGYILFCVIGETINPYSCTKGLVVGRLRAFRHTPAQRNSCKHYHVSCLYPAVVHARLSFQRLGRPRSDFPAVGSGGARRGGGESARSGDQGHGLRDGDIKYASPSLPPIPPSRLRQLAFVIAWYSTVQQYSSKTEICLPQVRF